MFRGGPPTIDHGSSRAERFLRSNRYKLILSVVIVEALLVALGALSFWLAVVIAGCLLVLFLLFRRELSGASRELAWIVAGSQALGVLVFVLVLVTAVLLVVAVVVLAIAVLASLLVNRR
jgi:ABC-type antimicrobial peptide transport system permease subunit